MICIGVDPGQSRVGLALGQGTLALALESIPAVSAAEAIQQLAADKHAERIYVGLPISLSGASTQSTQAAIDLAKDLAGRVELPVVLIDERLTTVESARLAQQIGKTAKQSKSFVDAEAARLIVETAISANHKIGIELEEYLARFQ